MGMHQPQRPWKSMQASNCVLDANLPSIYHIWPHLLCAYPHIYISTVHIYYVYIHIWFINTYYIYSFIHFTISPKKKYHQFYTVLPFFTRTKTSPTLTICSSLRYAAFMAFMSPISWWGLDRRAYILGGAPPEELIAIQIYRYNHICIYVYVYVIIVY